MNVTIRGRPSCSFRVDAAGGAELLSLTLLAGLVGLLFLAWPTAQPPKSPASGFTFSKVAAPNTVASAALVAESVNGSSAPTGRQP